MKLKGQAESSHPSRRERRPEPWPAVRRLSVALTRPRKDHQHTVTPDLPRPLGVAYIQ